MTKNCNFIEKLREAGLRPTKQRVKICEILFNREKQPLKESQLRLKRIYFIIF